MVIGEFCDCYPPHIDGVGTVVSAYARELSKSEECYYIAPKNSSKRFPESRDSFPVLKFSSLPLPGEAYRLGVPGVDLSFHLDLRKISFDIVHAHTPFSAGVEALHQAELRGIPLVGTFHSKYYDDFYKKTRSGVISKAAVKLIVGFYEKCDEVWAVNEATAQVLKDYGYRGDIVVMPNGTNLWYPKPEDARHAQEKYGLGEGTVFLFVGQHNFKKNTRSILEAAALYKKQRQDFRLVFAGQGPDAEAMKELSRDLGLEGETVFTGHIADRRTLFSLYARADLLVFPSLYDNAPMVVREAAAAGTPSLLIAGSCAAEGVTDGVNGFLCENTPEAICATMLRALPEAKAVGEKARETIPQPWSGIMRDVLARYRALIEKKKA
jgi:glycosyltransferase involved in cell wall biosynthesis